LVMAPNRRATTRRSLTRLISGVGRICIDSRQGSIPRLGRCS